MDLNGITIDEERLDVLAHRWGIASIAVFGSVLRDDFGDDSDVDLLVKFSTDSDISALDLVQIRDELSVLFGRLVDLVEPASLVNPYRREAILSKSHTIYAA